MTGLLDVLAAHGIKQPAITVRAAADAGLPLPAACIVLMDETGGGVMEWGHDPVDPQGCYVKGGPVTQDNVNAYLRGPATNGNRQGCGDGQPTSSGYQDRAMALGGLWDHYANQRSCFEGLARLISAHGVQVGFQQYNGGTSGSAASVAYGQRSAAAFATWTSWIAGATPQAPAAPAHHHHGVAVYPLPATPAPVDPNSDPATWPQRNFDVGFDVAGGWEGSEASAFGVQDFAGRSVDGTRGFLRLASWIMSTGQLVPVNPGLSATGKGGPIVNHWPTGSWVAPNGAVGVTLNYSAPGGAYLTEGRSA